MKRATLLLAIFAHSHVLALPTLCEIKKFFGFSNYGASIYINDRDAKRFLAKLQAGEPLPFDDPEVYDYLQNLYAQEYGINLAELIQETLGLQDVTQVQFIPLAFTEKYSEESFRAHVQKQSEKYSGEEKRIHGDLLWHAVQIGTGVLLLLIPHQGCQMIGAGIVMHYYYQHNSSLKELADLNEKNQEKNKNEL